MLKGVNPISNIQRHKQGNPFWTSKNDPVFCIEEWLRIKARKCMRSFMTKGLPTTNTPNDGNHTYYKYMMYRDWLSMHSVVTMIFGDQEQSDTLQGHPRAFPCSKMSVCNYIMGCICPPDSSGVASHLWSVHSTMQTTYSILTKLTAKTMSWGLGISNESGLARQST